MFIDQVILSECFMIMVSVLTILRSRIFQKRKKEMYTAHQGQTFQQLSNNRDTMFLNNLVSHLFSTCKT